jgi:hypothetical protein
MIEQDLVQYLLNDTDVTDLLGSENVFYHRAPSNVDMPWVIIQVPNPGRRDRLTVSYVQPRELPHVLCVSEDQYQARELADLVLSKLDFYRGDLYNTTDVYIRCGSIYTIDGYSGAVTCEFSLTLTHLEGLTHPTPIV